MSRNEKMIRAALTAIGYEAKRVWWEPLGPSIEMCGPFGGWFVDDEPMGLNVRQALTFIVSRPLCFARQHDWNNHALNCCIKCEAFESQAYIPCDPSKLAGKVESCCECGEDYPRSDLIAGHVFCARCRGKA